MSHMFCKSDSYFHYGAVDAEDRKRNNLIKCTALFIQIFPFFFNLIYSFGCYSGLLAIYKPDTDTDTYQPCYNLKQVFQELLLPIDTWAPFNSKIQSIEILYLIPYRRTGHFFQKIKVKWIGDDTHFVFKFIQLHLPCCWQLYLGYITNLTVHAFNITSSSSMVTCFSSCFNASSSSSSSSSS